MRLFHGFESLTRLDKSVVTLGSFDGVHSGHLKLLEKVVSVAKERGVESVVITFEPHPRIAFGHDVALLTTIEEKAQLLSNYHIDNLVVIPFDIGFSKIDAREFISDYIIKRIGAKSMIVGYNHRFGHDHADYEQLRTIGNEFGVDVQCVEKHLSGNDKVSSTVIRSKIAEGKISEAVRLLSHGYIIGGKVVDNCMIVTNKDKLLPPNGLYDATAGAEKVRISIKERRVNILDTKINDGLTVITLL